MKFQIRKRLFAALSISVAVPFFVLALYSGGVFERVELMVFDTFARSIRGPMELPPEVSVILVDEASLKSMNPLVGRWPWPRSVIAELIEFVSMGEPKAIVFDILFTENEKSRVKGRLDPSDQWLIDATMSSGNIFHAAQILRDAEDEYNKELLGRDMPEDFVDRFAVSGVKGARPVDSKRQSNNYYIPFEELYGAAKGVGIVEFRPDPDGIFRRTEPLRHYKGDYYPVLGLAPMMGILNAESAEFQKGRLLVGGQTMPLDKDGQYLINMYGKYNAYSVGGLLASAQKVHAGETEGLIVNPEEFRDKIVFVGASAVGVEDVKATSVSQLTPGVYLHASFVGNLIRGDFLMPAKPGLTAFMVFLMTALTSAGVILFQKLHQRLAVPAVALMLFLLFAYKGYGGNHLYEVVPPTAAILLGFMASFAYLTFTEGKEKRKVRRMLGQYVSPQVLTEVIDRYEDFLKAEVGSRENITVLFSDIRGFTSVSENMPPGRVVEMLNQYFSVWSDVIFKYGGTVDKFIGDAIMAFWGAPIKTEDHASKAVSAAIEMRERLVQLNERLVEKGYSPLKIGVGINSGDAILGNIGSEKKLDYTVIGDTINLASRVESLTKEYGCAILITEFTQAQVSAPCRFVAEVKIRGKEKPVKLYEVT